MDITVLNEHQILLLLTELFLLLLFARGLGEVFRRLGQPAVVGEILAGVLLGPTVFGSIAPVIQGKLFPVSDVIQMHMLETLSWLGALFLLMVAGMEVELSVVRKQGRSAILISLTRIAVAFGLGFVVGLFLHQAYSPESSRWAFSAFFGIACTVCAVPVLAKILHELDMLKSDIGLLSLSSSTLTDFVCWVMFTVVAGVAAGKGVELHGPVVTIVSISVIMVLVFTLGKRGVNWVTKHVQDESGWQSGTVMVFAFLLALGLAIVFQLVGVHAVFGFFLAGILIGESPHVTLRTREAISEFVMSLFSPLFFASIGMKVNFLAHFDWLLVVLVLVVVVVGKMAGVSLGAKLGGMSFRDSLPVASGMLAGGAMEIIISLIGLQMGLIGQDLFVALVVAAVVTSVVAGPMLVWSLKLNELVNLGSFLFGEAVVADLPAWNMREAVSELVLRLSGRLGKYRPEEVAMAVLAREAIGSTALGNQLAVPHARLEHLDKPLLAVGRIKSGIPMDSPDGRNVHLIVMILTPKSELGLQVQILAGIVGALSEPEVREKLLNCPDEMMNDLLMQMLRGQKISKSQTGVGLL
ncbi:MAG: PTS transporter subunit EIIA [Phycisphaerae bacterium]|nr:PTS transporter subunit EIIA [Phycisphaerae bacterium]